ncbi:MAG: L,D-transpeptidase family protein [Chitinophagaceae bacterium]|nr:L,D-transpeptidase family protein [Chitinophagaceae bacterium]
MRRVGLLIKNASGIGLLCLIAACGNGDKPATRDLVQSPDELDPKTTENIRQLLDYAGTHKQLPDDSVLLFDQALLSKVYQEREYKPVWGSREEWQPLADSLFTFLQMAKWYGLFPEDYHFLKLSSIRQRILADSVRKGDRTDAALWARADIMLTDAFVHVIKDLKLGRLPLDSISARKDSVLPADFYLQRLSAARGKQSLSLAFYGLEPTHEGYRRLKAAIPAFLANASDRVYTQVPQPKDPRFKQALQTRLYEGGYLDQDSITADSATLVRAVKKFQEEHNIAVDGRVGEGTVRILNTNDKDRFVSIAITLDRYKHLPDSMPGRYVWVNIPGYYMLLHQGDSINVESKIICGKPATRTPLLTSAISELITYPQWTVPTSIIAKEILPAVKRDPGYLAKKGFSLINGKGDEVDPFTVEWSKYSKGIPYKVVQGSGDANALGILKFNFPNKYAVYLHDTNQRYLFAQAMRSLSHGCVRVQSWEKLAYSIIRYDYKSREDGKTSAVEDSLNSWLKRKEKHHITVKNRLPVFIRYFTCEWRNNRLLFYDDIYGEDRMARRQYFAGK